MVRHVERSLLNINSMLEQPDLIEGLPETLAGLLTLALPEDESCLRPSHVYVRCCRSARNSPSRAI
jgi:hypothetical protein